MFKRGNAIQGGVCKCPHSLLQMKPCSTSYIGLIACLQHWQVWLCSACLQRCMNRQVAFEFCKSIVALSLNTTGSVDDALVEHFFGKDKSRKLTVEQFQAFHRKLRREILKLEVCVLVYMYIRHYISILYVCTAYVKFSVAVMVEIGVITQLHTPSHPYIA